MTAPVESVSDAEMLARMFHETYERLAPSFGYETRRESAKPWSEVPEKNRRLMIAVCSEVMKARDAAIRKAAFKAGLAEAEGIARSRGQMVGWDRDIPDQALEVANAIAAKAKEPT